MKTAILLYWFGIFTALGSSLPWIYYLSYQSPENVREACFGAIVGALLACAISSVIVCWLERRGRKWADKCWEEYYDALKENNERSDEWYKNNITAFKSKGTPPKSCLLDAKSTTDSKQKKK